MSHIRRETEPKQQIGILISSCDNFRDLWEPYFTLFWRYWPDCPYPIYLITNYLRYDDDRVSSIQVGEDKNWSGNCRTALANFPHPYVLYTHEDFLLMKSVDTTHIKRLVSFMQKSRAAYLRLYPCPGPDVPLENTDEIGMISKGAPYRVSLQVALWRKDVLESLLVENETGWDMELKGSRRSDKIDLPFLSVTMDPTTGRNTNPPISYFCTAVVKGKWLSDAVKFCRAEGIEVDLSVRKVRSQLDEFWENSLVREGYGRIRHTIGKVLRKIGLLKPAPAMDP